MTKISTFLLALGATSLMAFDTTGWHPSTFSMTKGSNLTGGYFPTLKSNSIPILFKGDNNETFVGEGHGNISSGRVDIRLLERCSKTCQKIEGYVADEKDGSVGMGGKIVTPSSANLIHMQAMSSILKRETFESLPKEDKDHFLKGIYENASPCVEVKANKPVTLIVLKVIEDTNTSTQTTKGTEK